MAKPEYIAAQAMSVIPRGQLTINSTAVVYSDHWTITRHRSFSLELLFDSDTDVNVKVELEQGNTLPSVLGSYSSNFVSTINPIDNITDENVHLYPMVPVVSVYARLKLTGLTGNAVTTKLTRANWVEVED
jgi:hypothetical protein